MMDDIETILLVENEPLIALDLESMLLTAGVKQVHHVVSCADAIDWLNENRPGLSILDVLVKDGSSLPVADRLRRARVPFLVHSGHTRQESAYGEDFADAVWLAKPCSQADLVDAVQKTLGLPL